MRHGTNTEHRGAPHRLAFKWAALALATCWPLLAAAAEQGLFESATQSIRRVDLKKHVDALSDDTFEGREAGSRGGHAAGGYLVREFQRHGLKPAGSSGSYFQPFGNNYRNLLGLIEGSDPALAEEVILIGAHYDHVGYGTQQNSYGPVGFIHNGADDNASGTSAVLELAEALAAINPAPPRTLLFALWDGEEKGLLGSLHWASNPTLPMARVRLAFNLDMVGRLNQGKLDVYGTRTGAGFRRRVAERNVDGLRLDFLWEMDDDSDHHTFYSRRIPTLMFFTGLHADYHRPSDDAEKVNLEGTEQVSRLLLGVVWDAAYASALPGFRARSLRESKDQRQQAERGLPPLPGRLGVQLRTTPENQPPLITGVVPGSPAAAAGVQPGERVIGIAGQEIRGLSDFQRWLAAAPSPVAMRFARPENTEPIDRQVALQGFPTRFGITWRSDDAEPGALIVHRVIPGTPAALAGLKVGDRLYALDGRSVDDSRELLSSLRAAEQPLELSIEREGRLMQVSITPLPRVELAPAAERPSAPLEVAPQEAAAPGSPSQVQGR